MIIQFKNEYLRKLYSGEPLKCKPVFGTEVVKKFQERILLLELIENTQKLREYKSLHFEAFKGNRKGLFSIRINKQYRLEFRINNDFIHLEEIILIEELSKHYQ